MFSSTVTRAGLLAVLLSCGARAAAVDAPLARGPMDPAGTSTGVVAASPAAASPTAETAPALALDSTASPSASARGSSARLLERPDTGGALPPGATRFNKPRLWLVVPGAALFGAVWLTANALSVSSLVTTFAGPQAPGVPAADLPVWAASGAAMSIPIVGPAFLAAVAHTAPWKTYASAPRWYYVGAATAQLVGLSLLGLAALFPERWVRTRGVEAPVTPRVSVRVAPVALPGGGAVLLAGDWR